MIIGRSFAWGHMGKTGGDAVLELFRCVPDLVEFAHDVGDPNKHITFSKMGVADSGKQLVLNIRRLPSLALSYVNHAYRYGLDPTKPKGTVLTPEMACTFPRFEGMLRNQIDQGRLHISRWLRMEHLRDDFVAWVSSIRPLSDVEVERIRSVPTKAPMSYDHDWRRFFSPQQVATLYRVSPLWTSYELQVYGRLPMEATAADFSPHPDAEGLMPSPEVRGFPQGS